MSLSRQDLDRLHRRIAAMIVRGTIDEVDDARLMQSIGVKLEDGYRPRQVEHWHPYGLSYHPHAGSEVVALSLGGNRDHIIVIPGADRRYRLKALEQGELAVHDDQGQSVHFKRGGLHLTSPQKVVVECPDINLGGEGGKPVAVEGTIDSAGHPLVSSFATKVKAV